MIEDYGIELIQMMENAGRSLAELARKMLDDDVGDRTIIVLAGRGNNGGGGMVAARHLLNWDALVQIVTTHAPADYAGIPAHQLAILQAMEVPTAWADDGWELPPCDLVIDSLIGYGLRGNPKGAAKHLIQLANSSRAPVLSLDAPSGLDVSTGVKYEPCVHATATMTLALPKRGLLTEEGRSVTGELYLADISVPSALYEKLGFEVGPLFAEASVIHLHLDES